MTAAEVVTFFSALGFRERLIAKLAVLAGMRPGEILGLRWGAIQQGIATIDCRVYRGKFDTPKNGLSREAALGAEIESDLRRWAEISTNRAADALVFPSEKGTPLLRDNLWRRFFKPRLEPVGLAWATFQVLRATNASLKHEAGVDPKVAADQRGHGLGVSLEVYTRSSRDQKKEAVGKLESMLARNRNKSSLREVAGKE